MSGKNKNTRFYTARDIQKYLEGELSAPEMHALEKAALEDPFLADAIEGVENNRLIHGETSFQNGLGDLRQRLENKLIEKNKRRTPILFHSRWRIAAAIILLIGLAAGTYRYLFSEKRRLALARSERAVAVADSTAVTAIPANPVTSGNPVTPGKTNGLADQAEHPVPANPAPGETFRNTGKEKFSDSSKYKFFKPSLSSPLTADNSERRSKNQMQARPVQQAAETFSLKSQENSILSRDSLPPSPSRDPTLGSTLVGKVAGITVGKPQTNTLDEVVVVGYGEKRKKMIAGSVSSIQSDSTAITGQHAVPDGGWEEYKSWLKKNKKTGISDSTLKGNEIISFRVNKKGELSSFKIEHSLSPTHDTVAIRLVKEGPAWKLLKGKKTRVTVVVSF